MYSYQRYKYMMMKSLKSCVCSWRIFRRTKEESSIGVADEPDMARPCNSVNIGMLYVFKLHNCSSTLADCLSTQGFTVGRGLGN